jgi:hypothetical protein
MLGRDRQPFIGGFEFDFPQAGLAHQHGHGWGFRVGRRNDRHGFSSHGDVFVVIWNMPDFSFRKSSCIAWSRFFVAVDSACGRGLPWRAAAWPAAPAAGQ